MRASRLHLTRSHRHLAFASASQYGDERALQADDYVIPKMKYKGVAKDGWGSKARPEKMRVRAEPKKLVEEVEEAPGARAESEPPSFALRAGPAPKKQLTAGEGGRVTPASAGRAATSAKQQQQLGRRRQPPAAASLPAAPVDTRPKLSAKLTFEGSPADFALLEVTLPPTQALQMKLGAKTKDGGAGAVKVRTLRDTIEVSVTGCQALRQELPFAVDGEHAVAVHSADGQTVTVRLPYMPLADVIADAERRAPHAAGELKFASAALLDELE